MRIGFIGLGHMGLPMCRNTLAKGHAVKAWDVVPALVDKAVSLINHRPRKRLGYLTPYEVFVLGKVPPRNIICCNSN